MSNIGSIAKALIAFLTAGGGAYTVALQDGVATQGEIVNVVILALVAGLAVYATPNQDNVPYVYGGHVEEVQGDNDISDQSESRVVGFVKNVSKDATP